MTSSFLVPFAFFFLRSYSKSGHFLGVVTEVLLIARRQVKAIEAEKRTKTRNERALEAKMDGETAKIEEDEKEREMTTTLSSPERISERGFGGRSSRTDRSRRTNRGCLQRSLPFRHLYDSFAPESPLGHSASRLLFKASVFCASSRIIVFIISFMNAGATVLSVSDFFFSTSSVSTASANELFLSSAAQKVVGFIVLFFFYFIYLVPCSLIALFMVSS